MYSVLICTFYCGHLKAFAVVLINLENRNGMIQLLVCLYFFLGNLFFPLVVEVDEICMSSNNLASHCGSQTKEHCLQEIQIILFYLHT